MSDDAVASRTGKTWREWFDILDAAGGTAHVADASSTGHSQPTLDTANGGTADTTAVSGALVRTQDK